MGLQWSSDAPTPIVTEMLQKYGVSKTDAILEIGCGEGRDSRAILKDGYALRATDISPEAVAYCRHIIPEYADHFAVLDAVNGQHDEVYRFIYAVAVLHMLVKETDRDAFYRFLRLHLKPDGVALICTMGDGETERQTDVRVAFELRERRHGDKTVKVAATSCRTVSFSTFTSEITRNGLRIVEQGVTPSYPDFNQLMYAVVTQADEAGSEPIIRKATEADLARILDVYQSARVFMKASGNPNQWGTTHPTEAQILEDIRQGFCHVLTVNGTVHGVAAICEGEDPTYRVIEDGCWADHSPYLTIHRVAGDGQLHGILHAFLTVCRARTDHIRMDTHRDNRVMQRKLEAEGFEKRGIIYVRDHSPRIAYEWSKTNRTEEEA